MRAVGVVPVNPGGDLSPGVREIPEDVLPDALFVEAAEEPLDEPVRLRRVGREELLAQSIVPTGRPESATLVDHAIVAPDHRGGPRRAQCAESLEARVLKGTLGLLRAPATGTLPADTFPIVAVEDDREGRPAITPTEDVGDIGGPAFVALLGPADPPLGPRPRGRRSLVDESPLERQDAVNGLGGHAPALAESYPGPQPPVAEGRVLLDQRLEPGRPRGIQARERCGSLRRASTDGGPADPQGPTHPTLGGLRYRLPQSSDGLGGTGWSFVASLRTSRSSTSSPIFCFSRLICSSLSASSFLVAGPTDPEDHRGTPASGMASEPRLYRISGGDAWGSRGGTFGWDF